MKRLYRTIFITIGWLALIVGVIALVVPGLPTTPFLILSAALFSRSSPTLHARLLNLPHLGPPIRAWETHGVIKTKVKVIATAVMVAMFIYPIFFSDMKPGALSIMGAVLMAVGTYIWTRPSRRR